MEFLTRVIFLLHEKCLCACVYILPWRNYIFNKEKRAVIGHTVYTNRSVGSAGTSAVHPCIFDPIRRGEISLTPHDAQGSEEHGKRDCESSQEGRYGGDWFFIRSAVLEVLSLWHGLPELPFSRAR